jgi:hypothetical protein
MMPRSVVEACCRFTAFDHVVTSESAPQNAPGGGRRHRKLQMLANDLPGLHLCQCIEEGLLGVHTLYTGRLCSGHLAECQCVAVQLIAAQQSVAAAGAAQPAILRPQDKMRFALILAHDNSGVAQPREFPGCKDTVRFRS